MDSADAADLSAAFCEVARYPDRLRAWLVKEEREREVLEALCAREPEEKLKADLGRLLGRMGEHRRLLGEYEIAADLKHRTLNIWRDLGRLRAEWLARLRLAVVIDEALAAASAPDNASNSAANAANAPTEFTALYARTVEQEELRAYQDTALEARALAWARRLNRTRALEDLDAALEIRIARNAAAAVARTRNLREILERAL